MLVLEFNTESAKAFVDFVQILAAGVRVEGFAGERIHEIGPVTVFAQSCAHFAGSNHKLMNERAMGLNYEFGLERIDGFLPLTFLAPDSTSAFCL